MILQDQLKLKKKGEQILCSTHKQLIIQLNIGKNKKLGERLVCDDCNTLDQQLLPLNQAEKYLCKMYQEELQTIFKEKQEVEGSIFEFKIEIEKMLKSFESTVSHIQTVFNKIQVQFQQLANLLIQQLQTNQEQFNGLIERYSKTELSKLIEKIANSQVLDDLILQQTAEFISKQSIVDGKLELKEKIKIPESTKKQILSSNQKFSAYLNSIKSIFQRIADQEDYILKKSISIKQFEEQQTQNLLAYDTFKYNYPIQLDGHNSSIRAVAMSNNDLLIASGDFSGQIILWDTISRSNKSTFKSETQIQDLIFSFDDKLLASAQLDQPFNILIFDLSTLSLAQPHIKLKGNSDTIWRIVFSQNSQFLISGNEDKTLRIWNLDKQKCISQKTLSNFVYGVNISQNQQYISACCNGGQAYLFNCSDLQDPYQIGQWQAHDNYACDTIFTPDSQILLTCGKGVIKSWSIRQLLSFSQEKSPLKEFLTENNSPFRRISIRLDNSILISNDGYIRIWNMENGKIIQTLDVPGGYTWFFDRNFSVSKDMKYIITGGENKKLKVYELQTKY